LVESLVNTFKPLMNEPHPIQEIVLLPSKGGRYEVAIDGELVYSKAATGQHTTNDYILDQVRARLKK
jgi:predicted Rdx family selenoprotein